MYKKCPNEYCLGTLTVLSYANLSPDQRAMDFGYLFAEIIGNHRESPSFSEAFRKVSEELHKCPDQQVPFVASVCKNTGVENSAYAWAAAFTLGSEEGQLRALYNIEQASYPDYTKEERLAHRVKCFDKLMLLEKDASLEEELQTACVLEHKAWKGKSGNTDADGRNLFIGTYERITAYEIMDVLTEGSSIDVDLAVAIKMLEVNPREKLFAEADQLINAKRVRLACKDS